MTRGTLIIRFIDLGLLTLLGFLNVADIVQESHLVVQAPAEQPLQSESELPPRLRIAWEGGQAVYILVQNEENGCVATSPDALRACLSQTDRVALDVAEDAPFQAVVDALDICKETNTSCAW